MVLVHHSLKNLSKILVELSVKRLQLHIQAPCWFGDSTDKFVVHANSGNANGHTNGRKRNNYSQGKRRLNIRKSIAQREDAIRKTVYVSDIDLQITEELLAGLFLSCGPVVDCRICGDPNSVLRFAFVEFYKEEDARAALNLSGTMLGYYPVRVLPSKTAIAPINPTFLPRSEDEREMCSRTIYCANIDKKVTQADIKLFFESICGEVQRLRLLGDYHHSTRIAFVEFTMYLDENKKLILAILDNQNLGKLAECAQVLRSELKLQMVIYGIGSIESHETP